MYRAAYLATSGSSVENLPSTTETNDIIARPILHNRPRGQLGIYVDIIDAKPAATNTKYASNLLFNRDLVDLLFQEIANFPKDVLKGRFERLNILDGVIFEKTQKGVIQLVSFEESVAIDRLVAVHTANTLTRVFQETFVTSDTLNKLGASFLVLRTRIWDDEIRQCRVEFEDGIKSTTDDTARVSDMIQLVIAYQRSLPATFTEAKDVLQNFAQCLGEFIQVIKVNRPQSLMVIRSYRQLEELAASLPHGRNYESSLNALGNYTKLREVLRIAIKGLEEGVCHRLAQVNRSYLSAGQLQLKQRIKQFLTSAEAKLEVDFDFSSFKNPQWQPRVLLLEQELLLGLICLPQSVFDDIFEADRLTDEFISTLPLAL